MESLKPAVEAAEDGARVISLAPGKDGLHLPERVLIPALREYRDEARGVLHHQPPGAVPLVFRKLPVGVPIVIRIRVMPLVVGSVADMAEAVRHHAVDPGPRKRHDREERAAHDGYAHVLYDIRDFNEAHLGHLMLQGNDRKAALGRYEIYP